MSYSDVESLLSIKCDSDPEDQKCIEMGINAEKYDSNGTYFAITGGRSPFCSTFICHYSDICPIISIYVY